MQESVVQEVGQLNWGAFKPKLAEATIAHLEPIQATYNEVMEDAAVLDKVRCRIWSHLIRRTEMLTQQARQAVL